MAITRGRGGACGEESRKFDCGSLGSSGDDRRRSQIICRNPGPTRPKRWQWEVCRSIAEKGTASTGESFLACREPPAGRSNRVTPDNPAVIGGEIPCRCNETDGKWLAGNLGDTRKIATFPHVPRFSLKNWSVMNDCLVHDGATSRGAMMTTLGTPQAALIRRKST